MTNIVTPIKSGSSSRKKRVPKNQRKAAKRQKNLERQVTGAVLAADAPDSAPAIAVESEVEEEEFRLNYQQPVAPLSVDLPAFREWPCALSVFEFGRKFGVADKELSAQMEEWRAAFLQRYPTRDSVSNDTDLFELLFRGVRRAYTDGEAVAALCNSHYNTQFCALPAEERVKVEEARRKLKVMRNATYRARTHLIQWMYPGKPSPEDAAASDQTARAASPAPSADADEPTSPASSASSLADAASSATSSSTPASSPASASSSATATVPFHYNLTGTAEQRADFLKRAHKLLEGAAKRAKVTLCKV